MRLNAKGENITQVGRDINYVIGNTFCKYIENLHNVRSYGSKFCYDSDAVGFFGRKKEWEALIDFCNKPDKLLWWAVTGHGGVGKSRISYEFSMSLSNEKDKQVDGSWIARSLKWPIFYKWFSSANCVGFGDTDNNMFIVIDYVHAYEKQIGEWISFIEQSMKSFPKKIRVLLIERIEQTFNPKTNTTIYPDWFRFFSDGFSDAQLLWGLCYNKKFLSISSLDESSSYALIHDYAYRNGVEIMPLVMEELIKHTKEVNRGAISPLYLLFITEAWINYKDILKWDRDDILEYFSQREEKRIRDCFNHSKEPVKRTIINLYMAATIVEELNADELIELVSMKTIMIPGTSKEEIMNVLYNNPYTSGGYLCGIEPDLVGEYFVLNLIEQQYNNQGVHELFDCLVKHFPEASTRFILRFVSDFRDRLTQLGIFDTLVTYVKGVGRAGHFTILNEQGNEINCEVLFTFDSEETKKSYIVFTDNSTDDEGSIKVFANTYDPTGSDSSLSIIESEEEWLMIEKLLTSIQEEMADRERKEQNTLGLLDYSQMHKNANNFDLDNLIQRIDSKITELEALERNEPLTKKTNLHQNSFDVDALVQRIDFKIAELESEERNESFVALYSQISRDISEKEYGAAILNLESLIKEKPSELVLYKVLSDCYHESGNQMQAIDILKSAFEIFKEDSIIDKVISIYQKNNDYENVIIEYSRLIEQNKQSTILYMKRADAYAEAGKYDEAISDISYVILVSQEKAALLFKRGLIYSKAEDHARAIEDYTSAYDQEALPRYIYARAQAFRELKDYDKAINDMSTVIKESPNDPDLYRKRGDIYFELEEHLKAIDDYTKAYQLKPNPFYLYCRGYVYCDIDYDEAIKDYSTILNDSTLNGSLVSTSFNNRGYCYMKKKEYEAAISDLHEAINADENDPAPYKNLGTIMFERGDKQNALSYLDKAIEMDRNYAEAYRERAKVHDSLGNRVMAQNDRKKADAIAKTNKLAVDDA